MGSKESDDEREARVLREFVEQQGLDTTQDRLGELSILAQINDMVSSLLDLVNGMTKESKTLEDPGMRTRILQTMRKLRERSLKIDGLVPRSDDSRRDTTIPPVLAKRRKP